MKRYNSSMEHYQHFPFLKNRFDNLFFKNLLNQYFFLLAFIAYRYKQSFSKLLEEMISLATTERIVALGLYDPKKFIKEITKERWYEEQFQEEIKSLRPEYLFIIVVAHLYFKKAFHNGFRNDAMSNLLKLLVHIEKRYDHYPEVKLIECIKRQLIFPDRHTINNMGFKIGRHFNYKGYSEKKIKWEHDGYDQILTAYSNYLEDLRNIKDDLLSPEIVKMINGYFEKSMETLSHVEEVKKLILAGELI